MPAPLAIVLSRHLVTTRKATMAFLAAGLEVIHCEALSWAPVDRDRAALVLLDLDLDAEAPVRQLVDRAAEAYPDVPLVVVAGVRAAERLEAALGEPVVHHVLPKRGASREPPLEASESLGASVVPDELALLALARRRLGVQATIAGLLLEGSPIHRLLVRGAGDLPGALAAIRRSMGDLGMSEDRAGRVEALVRGMLGQALAEGGASAGSGELDAADAIVLSYGTDAETLALSVLDRFGAVTRAKVLGRLGPLRAPGVASQLVFRLAPGRSTEVVATVLVAASDREVAERGTSVHLESAVTA